MAHFRTTSLVYMRQLMVLGITAVALLVLLACSVDAQQLAGAAVEQQAPSQAVAPAAASPTNLTVVNWGQTPPTNLYDAVAISAGYAHSVALKRDGTVVSWGNTPPTPAGLNNVVAIAAGRYGSLALKNDGTLVAWGSANFGQLDIPAGLSGVIGMAMGDTHSVAVKQDGTVVVWGRNLMPQMKPPAGLTDVVAVSASMNHTLALKRNGTVVAWGPATGWLKVPAGLTNVVSIVAGQSQDLALKSDGTVVAWGGDSNLNPPAGLTDVIAIDADQYQAVALKRDGTLVKWGYAYLLGVPEYVKGVAAVALGFEHTLLLMTDTTAPETGLGMAPAQLSLNPSVFGLSGSDNIPAGIVAPALTFECSLDGSDFAACTSPVTFGTLLPGMHTFAMRAKDSAGNVDATPYSYTWEIEDCADSYDVIDTASLKLGLACFQQRTAPGVYTFHILNNIGLNATPVVENITANVSLLIDGQNHALDGQGRGLNGLHVKPNTTVTMQNLTIRNARSQLYNAGGIFNQGTLTLENVTVEGNNSPSSGGGIGNHGTLTVRNSTIRNNFAMGGGGGIGNSTGTATIENSVIIGNGAAGAGGLYNTNRGTVTLLNVLFSGNSSARGSEIANVLDSTINGTPTYAPTCYWIENPMTGQVLTIPNQSSTPGTALVAAAKQSPTNGYQLWLWRADDALVSLPTGQLVTVQSGSTAALTPAVIETEIPGAGSQHWSIPWYGSGYNSFDSLLNGFYLSPVDATTEQTPVVIRHPDDFRYNNYQNYRNKWLVNEAPPLDCLAAKPVSAASAEQAPAISELEAPSSPDQLSADELEKFNAFMQPEAVTAEDATMPTEVPASAIEVPASTEENIQTQRIFLPLVTK